MVAVTQPAKSGQAGPGDLPTRVDTVVVGAGLAGLAATRALTRAGRQVALIEAADCPGGRVRTDLVDGYRFDRGFQLYNPAYPEGRRVFDYDELELRSFEAGVVIAVDDRRWRVGDPRSHPTWAFDAIRAPLGSPLDLARFARYALRCASAPVRTLAARDDARTAEVFRAAGFGTELITNLLNPFLSGVFLEEDLRTSRRFTDLILRSFVRGTPAVPALGMQRLPEQLAADLPIGALHLETAATGVREGAVTTDRGEIRTDSVVVAVGPGAVASLIPTLPVPDTNSCTTWYHRPDVPGSVLSSGLGILVVDPERRGPLVNSVVISNSAPEYAPPGETLVSSTAIGLHGANQEGAVRSQLAQMYGVDTGKWEVLATYRIPDALPAMAPPLSIRQPVELGDGLFVAGDHRDTASIQGALVSGRRAADAVLRARR